MRFCHTLRTAPAFVCVAALVASSSWAIEANPQRSSVAQAPRESLKQIAVDPGLKVELVANEPDRKPLYKSPATM